MTLPFAITMGDASGVGPEILLRAAAAGDLADDVIVYGDASILLAGCERLALPVPLRLVPESCAPEAGTLTVVDCAQLSASDLTPGVINEAAGAAARAYVVRAALDALAGRNAGLVTLPMNKQATQLSDPQFCGHTELIAATCGCADYSMMLVTPDVACTHVSTHVSLSEAIERVRRQRVLNVIRLTHRTLQPFIDLPRIAVAGLNPHAGEGGLFGNQEAEEIAPAIADAQAEGIDVSGPLPGDTVFHQAVRRHRFDAVVVMYHDQGHIPMKLLALEEGVNVTIGLPIIRTSVDHGTAFDIAWQGKAFTASLGHALAYARKLAGRDSETR